MGIARETPQEEKGVGQASMRLAAPGSSRRSRTQPPPPACCCCCAVLLLLHTRPLTPTTMPVLAPALELPIYGSSPHCACGGDWVVVHIVCMPMQMRACTPHLYAHVTYACVRSRAPHTCTYMPTHAHLRPTPACMSHIHTRTHLHPVYVRTCASHPRSAHACHVARGFCVSGN